MKKDIPNEPKKNVSEKELSEYYENYSDFINAEELTSDEIKAQKNLIKKATKTYRSQFNLTMPGDKLDQLKKIAKKKGAPPSTLARMWLIERLDQEAGQI